MRDNQAAFAAPRRPAEIAVLLSNPSTIQYDTGPDPTLRDEYTKRLSGAFDLIRNQHYAVDFIADQQLDGASLSRYKLLVIPSLSILTADELAVVQHLRDTGGKVLAFGHSLERDERFAPIPTPGFLDLKSRGPAPWSREQLRLVEVIPALNDFFDTEIVVQNPEIVDGRNVKVTVPVLLVCGHNRSTLS